MVATRITFRHMPVSQALENHIRGKAEKLNRFYDRLLDCEVVLDAPPHKHQHKARVFGVRIDLTIPGQSIHVHEVPASLKAEEDIYITVNRAFHTVRRQLEDFARIQHCKVKRHSLPSKPQFEFPEEDASDESTKRT